MSGFFKAINTSGLEYCLVKDDVYEVCGKHMGDTGEYFELKTLIGKVWVAANRGEYFLENPSLEKYISKLTDVPCKPDRIIDIPPNTEVCHTLDLERVQYVGVVDKDGYYTVTMGWTESIKLSNKVFPRKELVRLWKAYHGQGDV